MSTELQDASLRERVFEIVRAELMGIRRAHAPKSEADIRMESSLVTDLGFDSLSLVEVMVALEQALQIEQLPLASWSEHEADREGRRFTVASLVDLCMKHASPQLREAIAS